MEQLDPAVLSKKALTVVVPAGIVCPAVNASVQKFTVPVLTRVCDSSGPAGTKPCCMSRSFCAVARHFVAVKPVELLNTYVASWRLAVALAGLDHAEPA